MHHDVQEAADHGSGEAGNDDLRHERHRGLTLTPGPAAQRGLTISRQVFSTPAVPIAVMFWNANAL